MVDEGGKVVSEGGNTRTEARTIDCSLQAYISGLLWTADVVYKAPKMHIIGAKLGLL